MGRRETRAAARKAPSPRPPTSNVVPIKPPPEPTQDTPDRVALTRAEHDELQATLQMHQQALNAALQAAAQRYAAAHGIDTSPGAAEKWTLLYDLGVFVKNP